MISQKATILCVYEVLKKYSDEYHIISADQIREKLKRIYDVDMERRAVYRNIDALRSMGIEIEGYGDNRKGYYLIDRTLEISEVRLLCDAVASSDMIREETSKTIIKKLIDTQSVFQGRLLQKTVYVKSGNRMLNKQLFYNIDRLNLAINQGCKVLVHFLEYDGELKLTEGERNASVISPYATMWVGGSYYILAKPELSEELAHYRIDRLRDVVLLERGVDMVFGGINPVQYAEKYILRRGENISYFDIKCGRELWDSLAEAFGQNLSVLGENEQHLTVKIRCIPSVMRDWVMAHADGCEVIAPVQFREEIRKAVWAAYEKYWK